VTGRMLAQLPGIPPVSGESRTPHAAVDVSGERAAIANGNVVTIYELPSGQPLRTVSHQAVVTAVAFAQRGRDLVTGDMAGGVLVTRDGRETYALAQRSASIDVVRFLGDGRVVVADAGNRLSVHDADRILLLRELTLPSRAAAFRVSSNGRRLLAIPPADTPQPIVILDMERYQEVARLAERRSLIFSAQFVLDDRRVLTAGVDGAARLWEADTGRLWKTYPRSGSYLADASLNPAGTILVTAGGDGMLRFWDVASARLLWTLPADSGRLGSLHFEGSDIVTRGFTGELARLTLPSQQDLPRAVDHALRCMPLRLDEANGGLVEQDPRCDAQ